MRKHTASCQPLVPLRTGLVNRLLTNIEKMLWKACDKMNKLQHSQNYRKLIPALLVIEFQTGPTTAIRGIAPDIARGNCASRHQGGPIGDRPKTHRTIAVLSYWGAQGGPLIRPHCGERRSSLGQLSIFWVYFLQWVRNGITYGCGSLQSIATLLSAVYAKYSQIVYNIYIAK